MIKVNLARSDVEPTDAQLQALIGEVAADVRKRAHDANLRLREAVAAEIERATSSETEQQARQLRRVAG